jgi:hypothetical protein
VGWLLVGLGCCVVWDWQPVINAMTSIIKIDQKYFISLLQLNCEEFSSNSSLKLVLIQSTNMQLLVRAGIREQIITRIGCIAGSAVFLGNSN